MKLRKILSLVVMTTMIMACSVFTSMPTAFAASDEYNETFDGFELTSTAGGQATMTSLKTAGWYPVDNKKTYSLSYSNTNYQFVEVVADENDSSNHYLKISTPNIGNNNEQYGLGRLLKSGKTSVTGNWKIEFDFKACPVGGKAQFNFGLNTYSTDTNFSATDAQHNIISAFNNKMYLGYRNFRTIYDNGVVQGTIGSGLNLNWYHIKAIVNCDARYYSVELSQNGALGARRSAISFAGDETIGFLKLSALGMNNVVSSVYVDNVSIAPTTREKLIYNETFQGYGSVRLANAGVTTGGSAEDYAGDSYFGGFTPWRAFKDSEGNIFKNYGLVDNDATLNSKVVRLGDDTETTDTTEASGLVYMPALEKLVTSANQSTRGKVKVSFKIKPSVIGSTNVSVNAIADHTQDISSDSAKVFAIGKSSGGSPVLYKAPSGTQPLDASKWYDIDLVFDVVNKTVETKLTEHGTTRSISFSNTHSYLTALKGIMFKVNGGSSVLMDDIKLEYYEPAPVIGTVSLVDMFGNTGTATTNVSPALEKIVIPVGCTLDNSTASAATIKLKKDSNDTEITYEPSRAGNAYTLILNSPTISTILEPNETYTVTVPATLANFLGDELGTAYTYTFTTGSMPKLMDIASVKVDGNANAALSNISTGSVINVAINYANSTNAAINGTAIVVFYGGGKVISALTDDITVDAGEYGTDNSTFEFTVPVGLNMANVGKVSVFLWDGFTDITPYCEEVSFE